MSTWTTIGLAVLILALAAPYVARIRHPEQKPFAAYLVFVTVFSVAAVLLFLALAWLTSALGVMEDLGRLGMSMLLLLLGVLPALILATWQARKPPMGRRPPD